MGLSVGFTYVDASDAQTCFSANKGESVLAKRAGYFDDRVVDMCPGPLHERFPIITAGAPLNDASSLSTKGLSWLDADNNHSRSVKKNSREKIASRRRWRSVSSAARRIKLASDRGRKWAILPLPLPGVSRPVAARDFVTKCRNAAF